MATAELLAPEAPARQPASTRSTRFGPGWQIGAFLVGYPLWWVLGVAQFVPVLAALPLAWQLRRRHRLHVPVGFWIWLLFLLWVVVSGVALNVTVEGTLAPQGFGRYLSFTFRFLNYAALTVMMLFVGNMSEAELPVRRVISWLSGLGVWVIALGSLAVVFPDAETQAVLSRVLPADLLGGSGGRIRLAQVQGVLGDPSPRPAAPFVFTNAWGQSLSLLLVWMVVWGLVVRTSLKARLLLAAGLSIALVPIVYSLNRGMWIGLGLSVLAVGLRQAMRGRIVGGLLGLVAAITAALIFSPLSGIVSSRLDNGNSNEIRSSLAYDSIAAATSSPVIGYGSTRATIGSNSSIAVGRTPECSKCGNADIGSTGQLWLILIAQGIVGACLYLGFFGSVLWRHRRDPSPIGVAGTIVVGLALFYSAFYTGLIIPLTVALLSVGLLWRNEQARRRLSGTTTVTRA